MVPTKVLIKDPCLAIWLFPYIGSVLTYEPNDFLGYIGPLIFGKSHMSVGWGKGVVNSSQESSPCFICALYPFVSFV